MKEVEFLKTHERLILGIFLLAVILFLVNKYINHSADEASVKAALAQQTLQQQIQQNTKDKQDYEKLVTVLTQQNQQLASAVAARNVQVVERQKQDSTLPLPDLAIRWQQLIGVGGISNTSTGLQLDARSSRATVDKLELVPVLQENVLDEETVVKNKDSQIAGLEKQVNGLGVQITDAKTERDAAVKNEIAKCRKAKRKWLVIGTILGVATRIFGRF